MNHGIGGNSQTTTKPKHSNIGEIRLNYCSGKFQVVSYMIWKWYMSGNVPDRLMYNKSSTITGMPERPALSFPWYRLIKQLWLLDLYFKIMTCINLWWQEFTTATFTHNHGCKILLPVEIQVWRKLMKCLSMKSNKINPDMYIIPLGLTSNSDTHYSKSHLHTLHATTELVILKDPASCLCFI